MGSMTKITIARTRILATLQEFNSRISRLEQAVGMQPTSARMEQIYAAAQETPPNEEVLSTINISESIAILSNNLEKVSGVVAAKLREENQSRLILPSNN